MKDKIRISGYTTIDISNPSWTNTFSALLGTHFGSVEALDGRKGSDDWVLLESLEESDIAEISFSKTFALRTPISREEMIVRSSLRWFKFNSRKDFDKSVKASGYPQNGFFVAAEVTSAPSSETQRKLLDFAVAAANLFSANYLFSTDFRGCDFDHRFDTVSGIGVGLKDIYPINFFGPAITSLIGAEALLKLPAEVTERHGDSVLVAPIRDFMTYDLEHFESLRARIRDQIGEQFFAAPSPPLEHYAGCIFALPFVFWKDSKRFRDERGAAKLRPVFDWSELWKDHDEEEP